jgi:adenylate kinase
LEAAVLRALLLAPPGAGKGTQGKLLAEEYGVPHLATGDLLRRNVAEGTPIGLEAKDYMERGELVPDELVVELVNRAINEPAPLTGFVLDGYPRTLVQATDAYERARASNRTFHAVIYLEVPEDELVHRLLQRGRQSGRADDTESTIRNRLQVYAASTEPLLHYYDGRDILVRIDGTGPIDVVAARIRDALKPLDLTADRRGSR